MYKTVRKTLLESTELTRKTKTKSNYHKTLCNENQELRTRDGKWSKNQKKKICLKTKTRNPSKGRKEFFFLIIR